MGREHKDIYIFISDDSGKYYRAKQSSDGSYSVTKNSRPYPIDCNPSNLLDSEMEFGTNPKYFSLNRSVSYPLDFIKDGAAILRHLYYNGKGVEQKAYITIIEWNGEIYELSYKGRFDFSEKKEQPKSAVFSIPTVDDSAWGILSENDDVVYSIECNETNPAAIPVLFDGIRLRNKYTFQTVQAPISHLSTLNVLSVPLVLVNEDGDSYNVVTKNQNYFEFNTPSEILKSDSWFFTSPYALPGLKIEGSYKFSWTSSTGIGGTLEIFIATNKGKTYRLFSTANPTRVPLIPGKIYTIPIDIQFDLLPNEQVYLYFVMTNGSSFTVNTITTNISVSTETEAEDVIAYGIRSIDLLKQIVAKATNNRYTVSSNFLSENNKDVLFSGDSLRGVANAKIYTSFYDFFKTFDSLYFVAMKDTNGSISLEKAVDVYKTDSTIIDLGEIIDVSLSPAKEYMFNEIMTGSPKQDFRRPSGRLEFNSVNTFSLPVINAKKKYDNVSKYRLGCYDIQFLLLDYRNNSTKDNNGDKNVYVARITDEKVVGLDNVETFESITFNNVPLQPIIKSPLTNDLITFSKPRISGVAPAGSNVNIYVDNVLDGNTLSDLNGRWSYEISNELSSFVPDVSTGIHTIEASYTDLLAPSSAVTITIDTGATIETKILYPSDGDSLYNNKPLIHGVAHAGQNIDISIDGVVVGSVVTDNSCKWRFKSPIMSNSTHRISINGGVDFSDVNVNSFTEHPIITFVDDELDGFDVINNLPLIQGVAGPGAIVKVWLNYIKETPLGVVTADLNGNWELQVVPVAYKDPLTGIDIPVAPIINGVNIVSTLLENKFITVNINGYKLDRPQFTSITGVNDNTVFNTAYSPKRMLLNKGPLLSSVLMYQKNESVYFQTADKNGNLKTLLNGVYIEENSNERVSNLQPPIAMLETATIKTKALKTFAKTLYDFNNGGVVKATFKGNDIFMLPIGSMKIDSIKSDVQEWSLLMSPHTTFFSLMNLYKTGTTIKLMKNSIYHSDYNSLHFVSYNFSRPDKYNTSGMYNDWFSNRNDFWSLNPDYTQKFQTTDIIKDQIITNGVSSVTLKMYRCFDASVVETFIYSPVSPAPIPSPDIVLETEIDFSLYPEDKYFFVLHVGETPVSISEKVDVRESWERTILIESSNSVNMTGCFFSTGFKSVLRVEGIVKKLQPDVNTIVATEESGDNHLLYSMMSKKRDVRFGTAYGLPDYLYLKIAASLLLDELMIEGVSYVIDKEDKIEPSDDVAGHPLYYYNVRVFPKSNSMGATIPAEGGSVTEGAIIVVDATAFGLPIGSLININIE